jgi:hypothetical protein
MNPYRNPYGNHYFGGQLIDPYFVIERFRSLLSQLPRSNPFEKRRPISKPSPTEKRVLDAAGEGKGPMLPQDAIAEILQDQGIPDDQIADFFGQIYTANGKWKERGRYIQADPDEAVNVDKVMARFREKMDPIFNERARQEAISQQKDLEQKAKDEADLAKAWVYELEAKQKAEQAKELEEKIKEEQVEAKAQVEDEKQQKEKEAFETNQIIKDKASRLADILKSKYNFKADTKIPKNLETAFMAAWPDLETEVIDGFATELEALKLKNDDADSSGKQSKELDEMKLQKKLANLANKRIRLKQRIETIARGPAGPTEQMKQTLAANPRGKVKIAGPGRGSFSSRKQKGKSAARNIEKIKIIY